MDTFDVTDKKSWYFGSMSRQDATELLMNERECGVFLVRDSNSMAGDYVLCVSEDTKVSNYIINRIQQQQHDPIGYRIGDQVFENLPKLLIFYTSHYLDTTPLRRPALRRERVIAKFDFDGSDHDDLPFRKSEILTIIRKDEDQWWTARNANGQCGQIPVPYVQAYDEHTDDNSLNMERPSSGGSGCGGGGSSVANNFRNARVEMTQHNSGSAAVTSAALNCQQLSHSLKKSDLNRSLPAPARVKQARVPNAYDKTALKLEIDDIIIVTKTNINGQWEGELKGKKGHFPFTHVEFIEQNSSSLPSACSLENNCAKNADSVGSIGGGGGDLSAESTIFQGQACIAARCTNTDWGE